MDKVIIEKIFDNILSKNNINIKCSKSDLTGEDKEFIEAFINSDEDWLDDEAHTGSVAWKKYKKEQLKHEYNDDQSYAVQRWGHSQYSRINGRIYNTKKYRKALKEGLIEEETVIKLTKNLQSAIDDGVRVPFNVVTHRIGHWDKGHKAGDVIIQKGFASTGLNGGTNVSSDDPYEITYYIPTGSKGVLLTPKSFTGTYGGGSERELLLGQGTRQYVLRQDDEDKTVEVLVLPDR